MAVLSRSPCAPPHRYNVHWILEAIDKVRWMCGQTQTHDETKRFITKNCTIVRASLYIVRLCSVCISYYLLSFGQIHSARICVLIGNIFFACSTEHKKWHQYNCVSFLQYIVFVRIFCCIRVLVCFIASSWIGLMRRRAIPNYTILHRVSVRHFYKKKKQNSCFHCFNLTTDMCTQNVHLG